MREHNPSINLRERRRIKRDMRDAYETVTGRRVTRLYDDSKVFEDLHQNDFRRVCEWGNEIARRRGIKSFRLVRPSEDIDYTVSNVVSMVHASS